MIHVSCTECRAVYSIESATGPTRYSLNFVPDEGFCGPGPLFKY